MDDYLNAPNIKIDTMYYAMGQHPTDVITLIPDTEQFCIKDYSQELVKQQANTKDRCSMLLELLWLKTGAPVLLGHSSLFIKGLGR